MPEHSDFQKIHRKMVQDHGKEKGDNIYYKWIQKHGYDDTKPMSEQKSKANLGAEYHIESSILELFPDVKAAAEAPKNSKFLSIPSFKIPYVAMPKTEDPNSPLIIKAITLEEGDNSNGWSVRTSQFPRVVEQYKEGRQLRLNHGDKVEDVFGKSYDSKLLRGNEIAPYFGKNVDGINPNGLYVVTEFEASPQDRQVRTNILNGYVETGSIGLDASAYCAECDAPLEIGLGGSMIRTCKHFGASITLDDVAVKEYSYVAEPAYKHSFAFPSFAAAVNSKVPPLPNSTLTTTGNTIPIMMVGNPTMASSSLSNFVTGTIQEMSTSNSIAESTKVEVSAAKKSEAESDDVMPQSVHEAIMKAYKDGLKDGRAEAESKLKADAKSDMKIEAKASEVKTDQVGIIAPSEPSKPSDALIDHILNPTKFALADPVMRELYKAAAEAPKAPNSVKQLVARWT